jgi:hypothetical protein
LSDFHWFAAQLGIRVGGPKQRVAHAIESRTFSCRRLPPSRTENSISTLLLSVVEMEPVDTPSAFTMPTDRSLTTWLPGRSPDRAILQRVGGPGSRTRSASVCSLFRDQLRHARLLYRLRKRPWRR